MRPTYLSVLYSFVNIHVSDEEVCLGRQPQEQVCDLHQLSSLGYWLYPVSVQHVFVFVSKDELVHNLTIFAWI